MKNLLLLVALFATITSSAQQDKSKRPSPPAKATATLANGTVITIDYSQPSVKGRTIGKDLEPKEGAVWRTGANEATVFEVSKDVTIEGHKLPAGKYGLFTIMKEGEWTVILNKTWSQWGAYNYKEADDVFRFKAKASKAASFAETMTFTVSPKGLVTLLWGDHQVEFTVK